MAAKNEPLKDLKITRVYDAPVKAVWDAWTDPDQAAKWWGPRGFSIKTLEKDLRPGGYWKYIMYGPDGATWDNKTIYFEVEKEKKLVYDHGGGDDRPPLFRVTVLFSEVRGKTKMEMTMTLSSPEHAAETAKFIKQVGGNSTWDRLAEYLAKEQDHKETFVINRKFQVPIETMFEMWSNPSHLAKWLPPKGMEMTYFRSDIRDGAINFYKMSGDNFELYGQIEYVKIDRPNQLVYLQRFTDKDEKPGRHPMIPVWPANMKTTVQFTSEEPDSTRVTITWEPQAPLTNEELTAFINMRPSMTEGWRGSLDKLDALLGHEDSW